MALSVQRQPGSERARPDDVVHGQQGDGEPSPERVTEQDDRGSRMPVSDAGNRSGRIGDARAVVPAELGVAELHDGDTSAPTAPPDIEREGVHAQVGGPPGSAWSRARVATTGDDDHDGADSAPKVGATRTRTVAYGHDATVG